MINITDDNYYSREVNSDWMSTSQFKAFKRCEAAALADIRGEGPERKPSTAMLVGSYVDAYFSNELPQFISEHPECFKRDGSLKAEFEKAEEIIQRIEAQPEMSRLEHAGETQRIFTGTIGGVPFRCKTDVYIPGEMILDNKVMRDFSPQYVDGEGRLPWWQYWGYDIQGAIYQEIIRQNTGEKLPFVLSAATKEDEPDLVLLNITQPYLDYELAQVEELAPRYDAIKKGIIEPERCEKCAYCRRTKIVKITTTEDFLDDAE